MKALWRMLRLVATGFLLDSAVDAQTVGRIEGWVFDPEKRALSGATVTVASPSLQGSREMVTGADGVFRFSALSPGSYVVKVELSGFNPLEVPDVRVSLDKTASLELSMTKAVQETVLVTGEAPVINQTDTTSGADFSRRIFNNIPTARTFQSLALAAPGVVPSGIADSPSVYGASAAENRYVVDGLDVTDPAYGVSSSSLAFEFIQEVQVKTGGYQVDYSGALGGVINVLTKSGGNEFHGDLFGYFNNDALQAEARQTPDFGRTVGVTRYDFGADAGGKILTDELWYFGAINPSISDVDQQTRQDLLYTEHNENLYFAGKLTWHPAPAHQLVATGFGDPGTSDNVGRYTGMFPSFNPRNAAGLLLHQSQQGAYSYGLAYNYTPGANLLGELTLGRYDQREQFHPVVNAANTYFDNTPGGSFAVQQGCGDPTLVASAGVAFAPGCEGGVWIVQDAQRWRNQLRASATYFLGNHSLKGGIEYRYSKYRDQARSAGPPSGPLVDAEGTVVAPDGVIGGSFNLYDGYYYLRVDDYDSGGSTDEVGLFVGDDWQITPYLTANLGVRFDSLTASGKGTVEHPDRQIDFNLGEMIAPRVGLIWDPLKNGRSRVFASYGRYFESVPLAINDYAFGNARLTLYFFDYPADGALPTYTNLGVSTGVLPIGVGTAADQDLHAAYSDAFTVGLEYELTPGFVVGLRGVDRRIHNVIEDIALDEVGATYFVTNPGGTLTVNPVTGMPLDSAVTFPAAERKYQALELTASKRFGDSWQVYGSYVRSSNQGNYGGLYRQDNGQLSPNVTTAFDFPRLLVGAYGPLPNDRPNQVKLYGSYVWPFGLVSGLNAQYLSGTPVSELGADEVYGNNERFVTPRGSAGRTSDIYQLDLHLAYALPLGAGLQASLIADLFNVTNSRTETAVDQAWTFAVGEPGTCGGPGTGPETDCPNGNPEWGTATAYQEPFRARFGVKLTW